MQGLQYIPMGRKVCFERSWHPTPRLGDYRAYDGKAKEPRYKIGLYGKNFAILRISDNKLIMRYPKERTKSYVLADLAYWNGGHFPEVAKFHFVEKISHNKRDRLKQIRAICKNIRDNISRVPGDEWKYVALMNDEEFRDYYNTLCSWNNDYWRWKAKKALRRRLREDHGKRHRVRENPIFR